MSEEEIRLEKGDVTVQELPEEDCEECAGIEQTHAVVIDFRSAGLEHVVGRYCRGCAERVAARIRDGLPSASPRAAP